MPRRLVAAAQAALLVTWLASAPAAHALRVSSGERDFEDGSLLSIPSFNLAAEGEPFPFDSFRGDDTWENFSASWTFSYEPLPVTSASLVLGLYDDDSYRPGDQVASFWIDGIDVTVPLGAQIESREAENAGFYIYELALPDATLAALSDGEATFSLSLQPGSCPCQLRNGAGIDFAMLEIIPEPGTGLLLGLGLSCMAAGRRTA